MYIRYYVKILISAQILKNSKNSYEYIKNAQLVT